VRTLLDATVASLRTNPSLSQLHDSQASWVVATLRLRGWQVKLRARSAQLEDDLRRLKQVLEVGEVAVSDATIFGTGYFEQRPAQPPARRELQDREALKDQLPSDERRLEARRAQQ